jgi:SAM-dependent methyltransferase
MRRPRFVAEQARNAQGLPGRLVAFVVARKTRGVNQRAIEALGINRIDHVLDLGCGHGRSLTELAARAAAGHVVGVDPSERMVKIASRRNRMPINVTWSLHRRNRCRSLKAPSTKFFAFTSCISGQTSARVCARSPAS